MEQSVGGQTIPFPTHRRYGANGRKVAQLAFAGAAATAAMYLVGAVLPTLGFPAPDLPATWGALFNHRIAPEVGRGAWWAGAAVHGLAGVLAFPLLFDYLTDRRVLPTFRWLRGILWGALLWFTVESFVKPLVGLGFFSNRMPLPLATVFFSLLVWYVYGVVLEAMLRVPLVHELRSARPGRSRRAA